MGTKPVVTNNLNFTKPAAGQPALISFSDVTVLFHEFGHALHAMFQNITYPTLGPDAARLRRVPVAVQRALGHRADRLRQLREAPQDRRAHARRARRQDQEGEDVQPGLHDDRVPRRRAARHGLAHAARPTRRSRTSTRSRRRPSRARRSRSPRCRRATARPTSAHIWGGGYAAGYYAYLWAEVIDDDAYYWFKENGGMTRSNGQRFRDMILSRAGSQPVADDVPGLPRPRPAGPAAARRTRSRRRETVRG